MAALLIRAKDSLFLSVSKEMAMGYGDMQSLENEKALG